MSFNNLQLIEPVLKALIHEGYTKPTPIQEQSIPVILQQKDLLEDRAELPILGFIIKDNGVGFTKENFDW